MGAISSSAQAFGDGIQSCSRVRCLMASESKRSARGRSQVWGDAHRIGTGFDLRVGAR